MKERWAFTFGFGQGHDNMYVIYTGTRAEARDKMINDYERKWSMQYDWEEFKPQIEKYGLRELK